MKPLVFTLILLNYASFSWSLRIMNGKVPRWMPGYRQIQFGNALMWLVILVELYRWPNDEADDLWLLGQSQILFGALFWWSLWSSRGAALTYAFSADQPTVLLKKGAYRWLRHPMYVSYLGAYLVPPLAMRSLWGILVWIFLALVYARAAAFEEQKFLNSDLAGDYRAYRRMSWGLLPWFAPSIPPPS